MTMPSFPDAPPLLTPDDVLERVEQLIGRAAAHRTLWLLLVDGDHRQTPVVMPIDDVPVRPDDMLDGLQHVVEQTVPDLARDGGPGSVIFVLERRGPADTTPDDRAWVEALAAMCTRAGVASRGVFLSSRDGVRLVA